MRSMRQTSGGHLLFRWPKPVFFKVRLEGSLNLFGERAVLALNERVEGVANGGVEVHEERFAASTRSGTILALPLGCRLAWLAFGHAKHCKSPD